MLKFFTLSLYTYLEMQSEIDKKQKEKQLNEFGIRLGLLNKKSDQNEVEFLHKTYAEYCFQ